MKVTVENFQSLAKVALDVEGLTVVVGESDIGKSALLRALSGALFNRPGEDFVREGKTQAQVTIEGLPGLGNLGWRKGHSANAFVINDSLFTNVGKGAPSPLLEAGYRDLMVGKETLRPQVASQFDRLFLLDQPGSFISDVLTQVTRLGVLTSADRACTTDLKRLRSEAKIREADASAALDGLVHLAVIPGFAARVAALHPLMQRVQEREAWARQTRSAVRLYMALLPVAGLQVKALDPRLVSRHAEALLRAVQIVRTWVVLRPVAGLQMPPAPPPWAPGADVHLERVRRAVRQRRALASLPVAVPPLPAMRTPIPEVTRLMAARRAAVGCQALAPLLGLTVSLLGPQAVAGAASAAQALTLRTTVQNRVRDLGGSSRRLFDARAATLSAADMVVEAESELATLLSELKICPVCQQPIRKPALT